MVADAELAARVAARHAALLNPASGPAQEALTALPQVPDDYLEHAGAVVSQRLDALHTAIETTGLTSAGPAAGFYLWLEVRKNAGGRRDIFVSVSISHAGQASGCGPARTSAAPATSVWQ